MKRIKGIPEFDRPREKMEKKGPGALSNLELLAVLLGSGIKGKGVFEVARDILKEMEDKLDLVTLETLRGIDGVGLAKAGQIIAAIEFAKRFLVRDDLKITSVHEALALTEELKDKKVVIDHIIVCKNDYFSFQAAGLLSP
jgi:DNA repair protein RadC